LTARHWSGRQRLWRQRRAEGAGAGRVSPTLVTLELPAQPAPRHRPLARDGRRRDAERGGRLVERQPGEVAQLDEARLVGVDGGEPLERLVEGDHVHVALGDRAGGVDVAQRHGLRAAAALGRLPRARGVDEHLAHAPRGHAEELRAALEARRPLVDEAQVRLVDERRGLERVPRRLALQRARACRRSSVDRGEQRVERLAVAGAPRREELRDVRRRRRVVALHLVEGAVGDGRGGPRRIVGRVARGVAVGPGVGRGNRHADRLAR
jgi:hypothetical protein